MPQIRPSADLRNNYGEISAFCHESDEPVFITKNGKGDLAVMSIELYDRLTSRVELYRLLGEGLDDVRNGRVLTIDEVFGPIRARIKKRGAVSEGSLPGSCQRAALAPYAD